MAGKSPGGLTEVSRPGVIATEVLEVNGLAETRPVTNHVQAALSTSNATTSSPRTERKTKLCSSSSTSHLPQAKDPRSKTTESTDDECRLLPGNYADDPDAILIERPHTKSDPPLMTGGVMGGGPRPTNTLGSKPSEFSNRVGGLANGLKRSVGAFGALITKTTYGDNVRRSNGRHPFADVTEPEPKRPRLGPSSHSHDSIQTVDGEDDVDMLSFEQVHVRRQPPPRRTSQTPSLLSQHSNLNLINHAPPGRYINEYKAVEMRMDSRPGRRKGTHRQHNDRFSTSDMSATNTPSSIIDLSADDPHHKVKPRWQGTARTPASQAVTSTMSNHSSRARQTGHTSNHLEKSRSPEKAFDLTRDKYTSAAGVPEIGRKSDVNLRDSFVQSDGARRNSKLSLSSDELQQEPYHTVTRVSPQPQTSQESPQRSHVQRAMTPEHILKGLPQSNIPSTSFSASRRKVAPQKASANRAQPTRTDSFVGVPLVSFSYGGLLYIRTKEENAGLVVDDGDGCLDVHVDGSNITKRSHGGRLQPEKLQKVIWAASSCKMRVEFSKCGTEDNRGDIELGSEKDVTDLMRYLQTSSPQCKVVSRSSETLDKMFEKRLSERKMHRPLGMNGLENVLIDIDLLKARKQRHDGTNQAVDETGNRHVKRRPTDSRIIDQLNAGNTQNPFGHPSDKFSDDHGTTSSTMDATEPDVAQRLRKEKLSEETPSNPHVTRSAATRPKSSPSPFEGLPPELRYSKMYNLGPRWSKPLIYPKVGKKKTTVEQVDLERLDEGEFLNDNLIGFYLRFLEFQLDQRNPDLAKRIYFFNTYFFASLTNTPRGKRGINYEAVRKWTRSIDLFNYDYVVVPINESAHWYVVIICNLPFIDRPTAAVDDDTLGIPNVAQISNLDGPDDRPDFPLQRASLKPDVLESLANELEKPNEQDTRHSFAGLNLEDDTHMPAHGSEDTSTFRHEVNTVGKDEIERSDIADDQATTDVAELAAHADKGQETVQEKEIREQTSEAEETPIKAPASFGKGKRKSMPPAKTFHPDQPMIITFDSLGLPHAPTVRVLKDYLHEEGKSKRGGMEWEDPQIKGMTAKQIPLQDNFCDCGLFLLGYIEKFLEDPRDFIRRTLRREYDQKKDWPKMVPSELRANVRELIQGLHAEQEEEKRENAIKAGKYRGRRQQVSASASEDLAQPEMKAADVQNPLLPTVLGNYVKPTQRAELPRIDILETAVTIDELDHPAGLGVLPLDSVAVETEQVHQEGVHDMGAAKLGSKDSTPIILDSQNQKESSGDQVTLEAVHERDISKTVADQRSP